MSSDPWYIKLLEKLGVNTTRVRWKLYQLERRAQRARDEGVLPSWLRWLHYPHKICRHCGAVNDRDSRTCHRCGRRLPSMVGYRLTRVLGLMTPGAAPVTVTLFIAAIVFVYGAMLLIDMNYETESGAGGLVRILVPSNEVMDMFGAWASNHSISDWWRIFAFSLCHAGIIHIGFNGFALSQVGPLIESNIGRRRMLVLITWCQLSAAAGTWFWYVAFLQQGFLTIGASGWLFGLIGFGVAYFHRMGGAGQDYRTFFVQWAIYGILFGILIGANNAAHVGGLIGGALLAYAPEPRIGRQSRAAQVWEIAFWLSVILWIATLLFMARSVFFGVAALSTG